MRKFIENNNQISSEEIKTVQTPVIAKAKTPKVLITPVENTNINNDISEGAKNETA
jgi:hypothetical protein